MRVLIVKLSSLGDVVHTLPVVHDMLTAHPEATIDWVVEPGFAPLLRRVQGVSTVIECALRRWTGAWWTSGVRAEWRAFRTQLREQRYDAVIDFQGLTKSAVIARMARLSEQGARYGLANRTEGASHEPPARWLVDHAVYIEPRTHALDRARELAARALGYTVQGPPRFGLLAAGAALHGTSTPAPTPTPTLVFVHGTSRDDKLWPEASWVALGRQVIAQGWRIALPQAGGAERERAERIAQALGASAEVWPLMSLDSLVDRLSGTQGVIGVDSGVSHIAVALDLPHVQIYNFPTAWRTGPLASHGHVHQTVVEAAPTPRVDDVWAAWAQVRAARAA